MDLTPEEQRYVDAVVATSPTVALAHQLTLAFLALVQQRKVAALPSWLEAATQKGLAPDNRADKQPCRYRPQPPGDEHIGRVRAHTARAPGVQTPLFRTGDARTRTHHPYSVC